MRIQVVECIAGTTLRTTWVSSGVAPGSISSALLSGSETLVNSIAATSSGDGHYFGLHNIPSSGGWLINEWISVIGVNTYINRQLVKAHRLEVD